MKRPTQTRLVLAFAPAVMLGACGGSIDLQSPRPANGPAGGGASSASAAGTAQQLPAGNQAGEPQVSQGSGGKIESTTPPEAAAGAAGAPAPAFDPKGAFLAFDAEPDGESRGIYWVSAPQSMCRERISPDGVSAKQPAFSSDGKLIAYAAEDEAGTYQIFTWETSGGAVARQVTHVAAGATYPAFMPSGTGLVFVSGDPEGLRDGLVADTRNMGDVMLVNLKTLQTQLLEPRATGPEAYPYFAPAFATQDSLLVTNSYVIRELGLDYSGQDVSVVERRVLTSPGVPQEPAPSPDGLNVAYPDTCTDTLILYRLSRAAGSPRSCTPPSRNYLAEAGVRSPDWGSFGFVAAEINAPNAQGLLLFNDTDFSQGPTVATPKHPRNPSWGPADFTRRCQ
jgi:Tol biopolymer transport system component